jgi:hypothetical protein
MTELPDAAGRLAAVRDTAIPPWVAPDRPAEPADRTPFPAPTPPDGHHHATAEGRGAPGPGPGWGSVPLRPLDLGDILDGTFAAIRRNPRTILGLAALLVTVQELLTLAVQALTGDLPDTSFDQDAGVSLGIGPGLLAGLLIRAVLGAVLAGTVVVVVSEDLLGRRTTIGGVWRRVRPRLVGLVVAALLVGALPYVGLLLVVPGVLLWGAWTLTMPALVLEGHGPVRALRRSWRLAWPAFWRVWSIRLLSVVLGYVMQSLIATPFALVATVTVLLTGDGSAAQIPPYALAIIAFGDIVAGTLVGPFYAGVLALLYVDRRMRAEGLDIALQLERRPATRGTAGAVPVTGTGPAAPAPVGGGL